MRRAATAPETKHFALSGLRCGKMLPVMSLKGQKRKSAPRPIMSALPPKADIRVSHRHVCFGPISEVSRSFDHLVGAREQRRGNFKTESLRSSNVYDEVELGRLLDPKMGGLRPPQNLSTKSPARRLCGSR